MNTISDHDTLAVAAAAPIESSTAEGRRSIPLSLLRPSKCNVRSAVGTSIPELAASIGRLGLLQNLSVVAAADGVHFEVIAGRRRLSAMKLLVKRRRLLKDHAVPCLIVAHAAARTVSLTENVLREAMHPADQFEAFASLVAEGRAVEDIAADFGVTPLVVQRRLRLANVSPRLLADYRADGVTLEQLMALAITDDHAAQEVAFYESSQWQGSPDALRCHLTREEVDAGRDPVARFVGQDAYQSASGAIRRDLFADQDSGTFMIDVDLLHSLASDLLATVAEDVRSEGWAWVDLAPRVAAAELYRFRRAASIRRKQTTAEAKRSAALGARQSELQDQLDESEDMSDEQSQALQVALVEVAREIEAFERSLVSYAPAVIASAWRVGELGGIGCCGGSSRAAAGQ